MFIYLVKLLATQFPQSASLPPIKVGSRNVIAADYQLSVTEEIHVGNQF